MDELEFYDAIEKIQLKRKQTMEKEINCKGGKHLIVWQGTDLRGQRKKVEYNCVRCGALFYKR